MGITLIPDYVLNVMSLEVVAISKILIGFFMQKNRTTFQIIFFYHEITLVEDRFITCAEIEIIFAAD